MLHGFASHCQSLSAKETTLSVRCSKKRLERPVWTKIKASLSPLMHTASSQMERINNKRWSSHFAAWLVPSEAAQPVITKEKPINRFVSTQKETPSTKTALKVYRYERTVCCICHLFHSQLLPDFKRLEDSLPDEKHRPCKKHPQRHVHVDTYRNIHSVRICEYIYIASIWRLL